MTGGFEVWTRLGHVCVQLGDLRLEQRLQLGPLGLQGRSQQPVLDGELLWVEVDVLHLHGGAWGGQRQTNELESVGGRTHRKDVDLRLQRNKVPLPHSNHFKYSNFKNSDSSHRIYSI